MESKILALITLIILHEVHFAWMKFRYIVIFFFNVKNFIGENLYILRVAVACFVRRKINAYVDSYF